LFLTKRPLRHVLSILQETKQTREPTIVKQFQNNIKMIKEIKNKTNQTKTVKAK